MSGRPLAWIRPVLALPPAFAAVVCALLVRDFLTVYRGGVAGGLFCGGAASAGCEAVAAHPSALVWGFPLAGWGLFVQLALLSLAAGAGLLRAPERRTFLAAGAVLAGTTLLGALWLLRVMWVEVGATCGGCLVVHGLTLVSLAGFCGALIEDRRASPDAVRWRSMLPGRGPMTDSADESAHFKSLLKLLGWVVLLGSIALAGARTLRPLREIRTWGEHQVADFHRTLQDGTPTVDMARFDDQVWSGPADADLRIVVVGDFECSQCRSLDRTLEQLRRDWPGRLAIAFVNAPLSSQCNPAVSVDLHQDACWLAAAGECAGDQGRFADYQRMVFDALPLERTRRDWIAARLAELGLELDAFEACMESGRGAEAVRRDVELCRELGLTTTPSIVIEGHVKLGSVHPWMLREMLAPLVEDQP